MRRMRVVIFALLLGFCSTAEIVAADEAAGAWKALRAGGHVALMRHADAPGGAGDPPGFRVDDCATQRNLSEKGRADTAKIGERLKQEGIVFENPEFAVVPLPSTRPIAEPRRSRNRGDIRQCGRAARSKGGASRQAPARLSPNGMGHQTCSS